MGESQYEIIEAKTEEQKKMVFSIRYQAYSSNNSIDSLEEKLFYDKYDYMENTASYLLLKDDTPIGSVRKCSYNPEKNWLDIPSLKNFKKEIKKHVGFNKKILEINKLCVTPNHQKNPMNILLLSNRDIAQGIMEKTDYYVAGLKQKDLKFYEKIFPFIPISKSKKYEGLKFETILCLLRFNPKFKVIINESKKTRSFKALLKKIRRN